MISDETRAKISAGVKKAAASGRKMGRPFEKGNPIRRKTRPGRPPQHVIDRGVQNLTRTSEEQSRRTLKRLAWEERESETLRAQGFEVFAPSVVCDRVAIKDGAVWFVEFKKPGQSLRPAQQKVKSAAERYLVVYSDC